MCANNARRLRLQSTQCIHHRQLGRAADGVAAAYHRYLAQELVLALPGHEAQHPIERREFRSSIDNIVQFLFYLSSLVQATTDDRSILSQMLKMPPDV
jgi:hypothetical protein